MTSELTTEERAALQDEVRILCKSQQWSETTASRDAFAIEALKGLLSGAGSYTPQEIARLTYRIADAMIDERAK